MTMICVLCLNVGIYWSGDLLNNPHTYCPHCGGTNCHKLDELEYEEEEETQNDK